MKLSREQAEGHITAGRPVAFHPQGGGPARTLQIVEKAAAGKKAGRPRLPEKDELGEYLLLADEKGNLTRAGMEHAIRHGGSVLLDGTLIESVDELPTEAELARGDERRTALVRESIDEKIAALQAQRSKLDESAEDRVTTEPTPAPATEPVRPVPALPSSSMPTPPPAPRRRGKEE